MSAPLSPLRIYPVIVDFPVAQTGIIDVRQFKLPDNIVRLVGVCLTNAVTDQPLRTNLRYQGTAAAAQAVTEANIELLTKATLDASFSYFDVPAPGAAKPIYFAYPARLGAARFYAGPDADAPAVAFTRRGTAPLSDTELSVNESFVLYESVATITTATRIYVRGLNLTGRPAVPEAVLGDVTPPSA